MTSLFKKKFIRVPHFPGGNAIKEIGRNAFVDWILVLVVSVLVGGSLVAGGTFLYWEIISGNFKVTDAPEVSDKVFEKKDLDSLINSYKAREDMSAQIKRGYRGPSDPSL